MDLISWTCLALLHVFGCITGQDVTLSLGKVSGIRQRLFGKDLDSFLGIPYAKPPLGSRRFREAEELDHFENGEITAVKAPKACIQLIDSNYDRFPGVEMWNPNTNTSEDCLYLNIWRPQSQGDEPMAVMVWFYGGGFHYGSSALDIYDGRILAASQNVIVVSMQYRMGPFGFLFLNNSAVPGNTGLLDQLVALRWINKHISAFGGDPERVTIFGESAGAASCSLHLLSPLSQGLFKHAILQSGAVPARWAFVEPTAAMEYSLRIAEHAGCSGDTDAVALCLQNVDAMKLVRAMWKATSRQSIIAPISATLDGKFITQDPYTMLASHKGAKKTPIMLGSNTDEGIFFLMYTFKDYINYDTGNITHEKYLEALETILRSKETLLRDVVDFEYRTLNVSPRDVDALDDILGDISFICPVINFANSYAEMGQEVYMYRFGHRSSANPWPLWMGVMHGYEIDHVFGKPHNESLEYSPNEKTLSTIMMKAWTNLAKYGKPSVEGAPNWPKYTVEKQEYFVLDDNVPVVQRYPRNRPCRFWRELYPKLEKRLDILKTATCGTICYTGRFISVLIIALWATLQS